ncbi:MAG: suppressor of fused domain protein [Pirellulaceae bacterium]|nr:suppressor of fused domain protein [Pirellulaceae bacterium]
MSIHVTCESCGYRYKLKDELAGRKVKCKICNATFVVPVGVQLPPDLEASPAGAPIYRHAERTSDFELAIGDGQNIELISDHIQQHIGPVEMVFHEIISDLIHIDVHWVKPTEDKPYHTLITSGMSDRPMTVPSGAEEYRYGEVMISLPPNWPMDMDSFKNEQNYWPVRWLKMLARFPHEYNTWLCFGHTLPSDDPPQPYADNTRLCCALLLSPMLTGEEFWTLKACPDKIIRFLSFVPIYPEELELKLNQGLDPLLERLAKHQIAEVLDVHRINVCAKNKKRGWWS